VLSLAACSGGSGNDAAASSSMPATSAGGRVDLPAEDMDMDLSGKETPMSPEPESKAADSALMEGRKIIRDASVEMETMDFEGTIQALEEKVAGVDGYVERSSVAGIQALERYGYRDASYTVRVPAERLDEFLAGVQSVGNVLQTSVGAEEITDQYYDTEARLATLKVQQERLLTLLEKSETLTDVIQLEQALSDVLYEIETLTGTLRKYDKLIAYSTVHLQISEVYEPTQVTAVPKSLGERISQRWDSSLKQLKSGAEDFLVWFVGDAPVLVTVLAVIALFAALFIWLLRRLSGKNRKGKDGIKSDPHTGPDEGKRG